MSFTNRTLFILAALAVLPRVSPAQNQWINYTNTANNWNNAANWNNGIIPTSSAGTSLFFSSVPQVLPPTGVSLQPTAAYAAVNDFSTPFALNVMSFDGFGSPSLAGGTAGIQIFSTVSSGGLTFQGTGPMIVQNGTGTVAFLDGGASADITTNSGAGGVIIGGTGLGHLIFNAPISGSGGLIINQSGATAQDTGPKIFLTPAAASTFSGGVTVNSGNVVISNTNNPFGVGGPVTFNGGSLAGNAGINFTNNLSVNNLLPVVGASPFNFSGTFTGGGGLLLRGPDVRVQNTASFTGAVNVSPYSNSAPAFVLEAAGTARNAALFRVSGGSLTLDSTSVNDNDRLNDAAVLELFNANFTMTANATVNTHENIGPSALQGGVRITLTPTIATSVLATVSTITVSNRVTLAFRTVGNGLVLGGPQSLPGSANFLVGNLTAANNINGVLPFASALIQNGTVVSNTFVRYDNFNGITPLNLTTDFSTVHPHLVNNTTVNYRLTGAVRNIGGFVGNRSMNSLLMETFGDGTAKIGAALYGTANLTLTSGGLFSSLVGGTSQPSVISAALAANLIFPPGTPGYISASADIVLFGTLTGSSGAALTAGLAADGGGTIRLTGNNTTLEGGLSINSGTVYFSSDSNLGAATSQLMLGSGGGGKLSFSPSNQFEATAVSNVTLSRPVVLLSGGGGLNVNFAGSNLTLAGTVSGSTTRLLVSGPGTVTLAGNNTFDGNSVVTSGTLAVNADNNLGSPGSNVALAGGTLQVNSAFGTTNRSVMLTANSTLFVNGNAANPVFNGPFTSSGSFELAVAGAGNANIRTAASMNGSVTVGDATPTRRGSAAFAQGGTTLTITGPDGALGTVGAFGIFGGGTIHMDNSAAVNSNRLGAGLVNLVGGTLKMTGNTGANSFEHVGLNSAAGILNNAFGNTVSLDQPASGGGNRVTTLFATSYSPGNGLILLRGTNLGGPAGDRTAIVFVNAPALVNGVLPNALYADSPTENPQDLAATATTGVGTAVSVVRFAAYTALPATGAVGTVNYSLAGTQTLAAPQSANGLKLSTAALQLNGNTLTFANAGLLLSTGADSITTAAGTPAVAFGSLIARISVSDKLTIGSVTNPVTLSGSTLVKFGTGTLELSGGNFTSGYNISQGTLRLLTTAAYTSNQTVTMLPGTLLDTGNLGTNAAPIGIFTLAGIGTVDLGGGAIGVGAGNNTFGGDFKGTGTIVQNGANTQTLNGNSPNFSGGVQIRAGTLRFDADVIPTNVTAPGPIGIGTSAVQLGDTIGTSPATLALSNRVNTFARDITVPAGVPETVAFSISGASGSIATLSSNITLNRRLTLNLGSTGIGSGAFTFTGAISGPGSLQILGGSVSLAGNNSYGGGTFLDIDSAGNAPLGVGTDNAFGTGPVIYGANFNSGAALRADNGTRTLTNAFALRAANVPFSFIGQNRFRLTGTIDLNNVLPGGGPVSRVVNVGTRNNANVEFEGEVLEGGDAAALVKTGTGTLILSGQNTYSGGTQLLEGVLAVGSSSIGAVSGPLGTGNFDIAGGTVRAVGGTPRTINNTVTISANFAVDGMNDIIMAGGTSVGNATRRIVVTNTGSTNFSNVVSGTGAGGGIEIDGTGTVTFSSPAGNTYSGGTSVLAGKLRVNNSVGTSGVGPGAIGVMNGAVLEGTGEIQADIFVDAGGTLGGGNSDSPAIGTLRQSAGNLTLPKDAKLRVGVLDGTTPAGVNTGTSTLVPGTTNNFFIKTGGTFSISNEVIIEVDATAAVFNLNSQYSYKVMQLNSTAAGLLIPDSLITFTFAGNLSAAPGSTLQGDVSGAVYLNFIPVPEPALLSLVLPALVLFRRRSSCSK